MKNAEMQEPPIRIETQTTENQTPKTTSTTKPMLTQEDNINIELNKEKSFKK